MCRQQKEFSTQRTVVIIKSENAVNESSRPAILLTGATGNESSRCPAFLHVRILTNQIKSSESKCGPEIGCKHDNLKLVTTSQLK